MVVAAILHFTQRFNQYWYFVPFKLKYLSKLRYWDLSYIGLSVVLLSKLLLKNKDKGNSNSASTVKGFVEDLPIKKADDDLFGRKEIAQQIAASIRATNNTRSLAIGIIGEYGSGKTSFLNMINGYLNEDVEKISFDIWKLSSADSISNSFFDLLAVKLTNIDPDISTRIYSYSRLLSNIDSRAKLWIGRVALFSNPNAQIGQEVKKIDELLQKANKKIVITVDDVDRLNSDEIYELLKLIRSTASFTNIFFLVGYDRSHIENLLINIKDKQEQRLYLDKIFQLEIPLPKRQHDTVIDVFKKHMENILSEDHYALLENKIIPYNLNPLYKELSYSTVFRQIRDVTRFVNAFSFSYNMIGEEVDFKNLIDLELIKFRFLKVYNDIYENSNNFLYQKPILTTYNEYLIPKTIDNKKDNTVFKDYIDKEDGFSNNEKELINKLFKCLFNADDYSPPKSKNSISYPLYFEIYFRCGISEYDLSDRDYTYAVNNNTLPKFINDCISKNLDNKLLTRLMQEDLGEDRRKYEMIVRAIFNLGPAYISKRSYTSFPSENFIRDKMMNYENIITNKLYKGSTGDYKTFIQSLFDSALPNFIFQNELIFQIKQEGYNFILSAEELTDYQILYFSRLANSGHGLSKETVWLMWGIRDYFDDAISDSDRHKNWKFDDRINPILKSVFPQTDPIEFLKMSIDHNIRDGNLNRIHKVIIDLFESVSEYREMVAGNNHLDPKVKTEYLGLLKSCEEKNFTEPVYFELKTTLRKEES